MTLVTKSHYLHGFGTSIVTVLYIYIPMDLVELVQLQSSINI